MFLFTVNCLFHVAINCSYTSAICFTISGWMDGCLIQRSHNHPNETSCRPTYVELLVEKFVPVSIFTHFVVQIGRLST